MKHKIAALILVFVMLLPTCVFGTELVISETGTYTVDGTLVEANGVVPYVKGDMVYLPVVNVLKALGIQAEQNGNRVLTANATIQADSDIVTKDGVELISRCAPIMHNGMVYADESLMNTLYDVVVGKPTAEGAVKISYQGETAIQLKIFADGIYSLNGVETGTVGPVPFEEGKVFYLPVVSILQAMGFKPERVGATVYTPFTTIKLGSTEVSIGSEEFLAKREPIEINGVIYVDSQFMQAVYGVKVDKASGGGATITYGTLSAGGDSGVLQTDDSWYEEYLQKKEEPENLNNIEILKNAISKSVYNATGSPERLMSLLLPNGSFSDLNYVEYNLAVNYPPATHIERIANLCSICYCPENPYYKDPDLINAIVKATDYWMKHKFSSTSWWYNTVAIPQAWQSVAVTQPDCLDKYMDDILYYCKGVTWTGNGDSSTPFVLHAEENTENLTRPYTGSGPGPFERIAVSMKELFWMDRPYEESDQIMRDCMEGMSIEFAFVSTRRFYNKTGYNGETLSIQADMSYHDHGNMFMQQSYGGQYLTVAGARLKNFEDTDYRLSDEGVLGIQDQILDGYKWVWYNGDQLYVNQNSLGRSYTDASYAKNPYSVSTTAIRYAAYLADHLLKKYTDVVTRADELQDFVNWVSNPSLDNFEGNRYFWVSDYFSHHRKDWTFSVLVPSSRMAKQEHFSGTGMQSLYVGAGPNNFMTTGDDISYPAARDWNRLSGITAEMNSFSLSPDLTYPDMVGLEIGSGDMDSDLAGGTSDGMYGMAMCEFYGMKWAPKLYRSWFAFDNELVSLGADIKYTSTNVVSTTVDQILTKGAVKYGTATESNDITNDGEAVRTEIAGSTWVLNGDVGYILSPDATTYVEQGLRTGDLADNVNTVPKGTMTTKDICIVGIDHGVSPDGATYEYTILPKTTEEEIMEYAANPKIEIISNTSSVQAVWHKELKILQASFYKPGTISTSSGLTLTTNQPVAVMVRFYDDGTYSVHASDPEQRQVRTQIKLAGTVSNAIIFEFTQHEKGWYAGKTMHYYSAEGKVKDVATYNPNEYENTEITVPAELLAISVNGEILQDFDSCRHYLNLGTFESVPEIKAKGNFETRVKQTETETIIFVTDPTNPKNEAVYTYAYTVLDESKE